MTWLFEKDKAFYIIVTPLYKEKGEDEREYEDFMKNYDEIFFEEICYEELKQFGNSIEELYNRLM